LFVGGLTLGEFLFDAPKLLVFQKDLKAELGLDGFCQLCERRRRTMTWWNGVSLDQSNHGQQ
jgi:hypothetical protein